jgi:LacI family transcriptional regulator
MPGSGLKITVREVARRAGVSPMTVSRVVNGGSGVSEQTRRRVEVAIADLGYIPNRLASNFRRERTGIVALIVPDLSDPFFMLVVAGAEEVARRSEYRLFICNTRSDPAREADYVDEMLAGRVEGVLIAPVSDRTRPHLTRLTQKGVPFVLVDRAVDGVEADLVQGDSVAGARELVQHLVKLGHKRIGLIVESSEVSTARDRLAGYLEGLLVCGIEVSEELIVEATANIQGGRDGVERLLGLPEPPTAVLAVNNLVAVGVAQELRTRGLRVPEDMALVCFDDVDLASQLDPFLTVMAQPAETFGRIAMQLLLERAAGDAPARRRRVVLPADLIVRRSCGSQLPAPTAVK